MKDTNMTTPPGIRPELLQDANHCKRFGMVLTIYDPESYVGGYRRLDQATWRMVYPISREDFGRECVVAVAALSVDGELDYLAEQHAQQIN